MNAIEFQNRYAGAVKDFFSKCLGHEQMPLCKMQDINMYCTENGFKLQLKTADNRFVQEFEVDNKEITPFYFETYQLSKLSRYEYPV